MDGGRKRGGWGLRVHGVVERMQTSQKLATSVSCSRATRKAADTPTYPTNQKYHRELQEYLQVNSELVGDHVVPELLIEGAAV